MGRQPLTDRQQEALDFIKSSIAERGYPPTLREIGKQMGIRSTNGVNDHLKALERKGYLVREELRSRAMQPVDDAKVAVRIIGTPDVEVHVDRFFLGSHRADEVFGLVVCGDSMIEDGIFDGDYVFVHRQTTAQNGEVVVVIVESGTTCMRFYAEGERFRLQPANEAMAPTYFHRSELAAPKILGKVFGVYRRFG
jgi:repressor LexA